MRALTFLFGWVCSMLIFGPFGAIAWPIIWILAEPSKPKP